MSAIDLTSVQTYCAGKHLHEYAELTPSERAAVIDQYRVERNRYMQEKPGQQSINPAN
jgi:hypothetical protein